MSPKLVVYRNISAATVGSMADVIARGVSLSVRNREIKELRNRITVLERPTERCLFIPHRQNNVFAAIAETIWVLAGRNDVAWLQGYLKRAPDFSDDGVIWRAGYGPRLRNWQGVDQLSEVRELLLNEMATRRAVMALYDPAQDFAESKDIPCNNWLHWLVRDGKLHLNIAVRSNDIVWGFSGVNSFEWSVLHQLMAHWIGVEVGDATYMASSFHIYEPYYEMAAKATNAYRDVTCYDFDVPPVLFNTSWDDFDDALDTWFSLEAEVRHNPNTPLNNAFKHLSDPFLASALSMIRLYQGFRAGWSEQRIGDELATLPSNDFAAAAYEHYGRKYPGLLENIPHSNIRAFFDAYLGKSQKVLPSSGNQDLISFIRDLHKRKNAAYGNSWKKRGEMTSILANIARKVDRLDQYHTHRSLMPDESIFDTAIDLLVYLIKYHLFLLERTETNDLLPSDAPTPFSDHVSNFDVLLINVEPVALEVGTVETSIEGIVVEFEALVEAAHSQRSIDERMTYVVSLTKHASRLIARLLKQEPEIASIIAN